MYRSAACLLIALFFLRNEGIARPAKVYLIPTLHRLHLENSAYNYDSLRASISRINPDIIAVEIRAEDIGTNKGYLRGNYPYEMWMAPFWFPGAKIAGFDWLGEDIAGKAIPPNYWKEIAIIKKLERELQADSAMNVRRTICDTAFARRISLLKNASLLQIANGAYSSLTEDYYACLADRLRGTRFGYVSDFYERRNRKLVRSCQTIIRSNPDKTIVILTGADHYGYIRKALSEQHIQLEKLPT